MGHGCSQFNVTHAFTPDLGLDNLHTAFLTDNAPVLHPFVFAAIALIILYGSEYLGAKQTISFRFKGPVIDGFRFLHLAK
jgi:hypothetical protein